MLNNKLEKLKIHAYKDDKRISKIGTFEAMFNPESYSETYANEFIASKAYNEPGIPIYSYTPPKELSLNLMLDGNNTYAGIGIGQSKKKVKEKVQQFMELALHANGDTHQPSFLKIEWGKLIFNCRLSSVDITYTLFDRSGEPLRAVLAAVFVAELVAKGKSSPDLTHDLLVKGGDNLPFLTYSIYQDPTLYLQVAEANKLDNFRAVMPGTNIFFPPIQNE